MLYNTIYYIQLYYNILYTIYLVSRIVLDSDDQAQMYFNFTFIKAESIDTRSFCLVLLMVFILYTICYFALAVIC